MVYHSSKCCLSSTTRTEWILYLFIIFCISLILVVGSTILGVVVMMSSTCLTKKCSFHFSMARRMSTVRDKSYHAVVFP